MSEPNETVADILHEIRTSGFQLFNEIAVVVKIDAIKDWADRLDAAAKRERENADLRAIHRCHDCERENAIPGNAAALRKALEQISQYEMEEDSQDGKHLYDATEIAKDALASPARNCDRFNTAKDALDAFIREKEIKEEDVDNMNLRDFFDWLYAPTKGGAKCIDGLRGHPDCRGCDEHCLDVRKRNCFYWNPDIGKCAIDGKPSCRIACDNFRVSKEEKPGPAEGETK